MKIIIIGAGLSGLCTALALRKYIQLRDDEPLEIRIYDHADPHDIGQYGWHDHSDIRLKNQGAAISLQANGLRVLRDLDPDLADRVTACGFPCKNFTWKTAGDFVLGKEYQDLLPVSRPILIQCLQDVLPANVVVYRTVTEVTAQEGRKPVVHLDDGTAEEADLVVGADGIRSPVRKSLFGEDVKYQVKYIGTCVVGGVLDLSLPRSYIEHPDITFILGPTGTFGYCGLSQAETNKLLYFSFYDTDMPDREHKLDHKVLTERLRERHKGWTDPLIGQCLEKAVLDNIYPICYVPNLPSWGRDGCVLVGDAAHAMTPASGQGGSQAFEDAQTLALLLRACLDKYDRAEAVSRTIQGLYDVRHDRVDSLKAKGLRVQEPKRPWSLIMTLLMYALLFMAMYVKYVTSFFSRSNQVNSWDVRRVVREYLAAKS